MRHSEPEVLIVGAGPVGLLTALVLRKQDVRVAIVDQNQRTSQHSYALALHPATLDLLDEVGLADALVRLGTRSSTLAFYEGAERRAELDFTKLARKHPYMLVLRQSLLERALEDELQRLDVKVAWNHRLQGLRSDDRTLVADVARLEPVSTGYAVSRTDWIVNKTFEWRPSFVVGADGYDSTVRRIMGIGTKTLDGGVLVSVFEIAAEGALAGETRVVMEPESVSVYWPLESGRCRWAFQIQSPAEHEPKLERLQALLAARAPWFQARPTDIYWSTYALFENRLADRFHEGATWLVGDAAHLASPIGVHSMNVGLREGRDLATCIGAVLRREAASALLAEFHAESRQEWQRLLGQGSPLGVLPGAGDWVKANRARIVACIPASGGDLLPLLGQLGLASQ